MSALLRGSEMLPRIEDARKALTNRGDRELARIVMPMLDFLQSYFTPPTPKEVDERLTRIIEADDLAHRVAEAAIYYLEVRSGVGAMDRATGIVMYMGALHRLTEATKAYQEGLAE